MDLVGASIGGAAAARPSSSAFEGGGLLLNDVVASTGGLQSATAGARQFVAPSEEPWDEDQYSSFAVESFMSNVLGLRTGPA